MKLIHILDTPPLDTNCFLLIGDGGHAVVVDPAAPAALFEQGLAENGAALVRILLTHGHHDHIGSVRALREKTGARLCMNAADAKLAGLVPDIELADGDAFTVDDMDFKVIFTPGHTPGSVCIRCGGYLFTGDTLFAGDIGRTDFAGGSKADMRDSLKKLKAAVPDNPQVLPGHEEFSTMDEERRHNFYLRG